MSIVNGLPVYNGIFKDFRETHTHIYRPTYFFVKMIKKPIMSFAWHFFRQSIAKHNGQQLRFLEREREREMSSKNNLKRLWIFDQSLRWRLAHCLPRWTTPKTKGKCGHVLLEDEPVLMKYLLQFKINKFSSTQLCHRSALDFLIEFVISKRHIVAGWANVLPKEMLS